jgi:DNA-directed RNA polymerase specialized sigma24 family protein
MTPPIPAEVREEIVRLRAERLTYAQIAAVTGVHPTTVAQHCRNHFHDAVKRAAAALKREIVAARGEALTAPLYHPETWG